MKKVLFTALTLSALISTNVFADEAAAPAAPGTPAAQTPETAAQTPETAAQAPVTPPAADEATNK